MPPNFWAVPAEVRRVIACTRDEPCVNASRDDDERHYEDDDEKRRPAPSVDDAMPPGQRLLDIPQASWRRQHEAWLQHAVQVNLAINHSSV
jgi:hypothetical protein